MAYDISTFPTWLILRDSILTGQVLEFWFRTIQLDPIREYFAS